jgi:hypothetical protein
MDQAQRIAGGDLAQVAQVTRGQGQVRRQRRSRDPEVVRSASLQVASVLDVQCRRGVERERLRRADAAHFHAPHDRGGRIEADDALEGGWRPKGLLDLVVQLSRELDGHRLASCRVQPCGAPVEVGFMQRAQDDVRLAPEGRVTSRGVEARLPRCPAPRSGAPRSGNGAARRPRQPPGDDLSNLAWACPKRRTPLPRRADSKPMIRRATSLARTTPRVASLPRRVTPNSSAAMAPLRHTAVSTATTDARH